MWVLVMTSVTFGVTEHQTSSTDVSFWSDNMARIGRHVEDIGGGRYLKKNNNKENKGGKNRNNNNNKKDNKRKDKKEKGAKKCQKNKNCHPTPAPTVSPPTLNLTGMSCGLFCDGKGATCTSPDDCCDNVMFIACDASEFGETGTYHCGRVTEYLGRCIEHDVVVHTVNGMCTHLPASNSTLH